MKSIAILLTVHNRKVKTLQCLEHLYAQQAVEGYVSDVYLTDDGCTDGTAEAIQSQYPEVHLVQGDGSLFWNRGMYKAWEAAAKAKKYDFYLWLNDDTLLFQDALQRLLSASEVFEDQAIIVGSTQAVYGQQLTYGGRTKKGALIRPETEPKSCDYFNGNIVLFPKMVFEKVGKNDPVFRHALGDFDYGLRAGKSGIQMMVAPGIVGKCDEHEVLMTWCNPEKPFAQRWKAFRTPLGQNPEEFFIFEKRHNGFVNAIFHYMTNHLRVLIPRIWEIKS